MGLFSQSSNLTTMGNNTNIGNEEIHANPVVSIIIPTYNRSKLLPRAVKAILNQTFNDFELIIVDDGSTDNTYEVIKCFRDSRIAYIRHDQNTGGSAARNSGIKTSRGTYIAFLDSDDEWLPTKVQKQMDLFNRSSERVGLIYTWLEHVFEDGRVRYSKPTVRGRPYKHLLVRNLIGSTSSVIIMKDALLLVDGFDESLPARQDMDLWVRVTEHFDIDFVQEVLTRIYHSHGSERISSSKVRLLNARTLFYQKHKNRLMKEKVAHLHLCDIAQFYREYVDETSKVRSYFLEAIRVSPKSLLPYILLLTTFLPKQFYKAMRSFKRRILG